MENLIITEVVEKDLAEILTLANKVSELYVFSTLSLAGQNALKNSQEKDTANIVHNEKYQALKVKAGNKLVGYIAWRHGFHIAQLYVDPEYQGKGIGTLLVDEVVTLAKEPRLKVRSSLNAVGFYKKYGFEPTGEETEINNIKFVPMEYIIHT
ncbi:GNAT family N-acetyltransferase [Kaarinaea lacus]